MDERAKQPKRTRTVQVNLFRSQADPRVVRVSTESQITYFDKISTSRVTFELEEGES